MSEAPMTSAVCFHDQHYTLDIGQDFLDDAIAGLLDSPKWASPKYFYDYRGSQLFDAICNQPEYYLTRAEEQVLADRAGDIAEVIGENATLIELGSGASRKVRTLLEAVKPRHYLGVDISRDFLIQSTERLAADYPWLDVHAAWADFTSPMHLPSGLDAGGRPVVFFPGSSIGNFTPALARMLLSNLANMLPPGGGLLIGVDRMKDREVLEQAYNDAAGVTAAFNRNLLTRYEIELGSDIDPDQFEHRAFLNEAEQRIEMHLVSRKAQTVALGGLRIPFDAGESIHTENSYKYSDEDFKTLAAHAGFESRALWHDPDRLFSVHYFERGSTLEFLPESLIPG
ncbi:L-histidine N(alpha)-methyltransferase [Larsenimonas suaedae]|uniref:L-histidine N(Alpha)-methyltransferase n=1 Tax=Larsenimonas suaedae TaxID=1851019 RepID=A0ABU1GS14_9GAMM|nr:L-histidine N(alpha)-methyltransferase [Larsenimonas suaedae]MCM2972398.1 L-histidine N(alpha)-methyltransferase [Larsenimonas suaedae]MDR5894806.1 L-histidine N(alpha)-methyltransferase [Larsenimonas suaedae]